MPRHTGRPMTTRSTQMAMAAKSSAAAPAAHSPVGAWLYCPGQGCGRKARTTRDGRISSHQHRWGGWKCGMSGEPIPDGATVHEPDEHELTLVDHLPEAAASALPGLPTTAASQPPAGPPRVPPAPAAW